MRLLSRAIAAVLVFFGVVGLLFGLEISDIERGQTQAICGAIALVGGLVTFLLSEIIARLETLAFAARAGAPAPDHARYEAEPALGLAMGDTVPPPQPPAMPEPVAVPQPTWTPPAPPPAQAATDHVDAAMAAVAAAIGEPEEEPASPEPAPLAAEAPRPGLAAILAANRSLDPARRPSLFDRVRAERAAASAPAQPAEPLAPPANPFAPRDPFRGVEPFGASSPAPEPAEAAPPAPVLNLRPTLVPAEPAPAPVERARPSLRALAASRDREEAVAAEAPVPPQPVEPPAPETPEERAPERPPFPRDIFQRSAARKEEPSTADMRLRERLAALRGETPPPEPPPAPVPAAPAPPVSNPSEEVVGRYESNGSTYVMFADGTIEAETETGVFRFGSLEELKAFIEGGGR